MADQQKRGFTTPYTSWSRGESIKYVRRVILDKRASVFDYMDYDVFEELVFEHLEDRQNWRLFL